jgi:predicted DNA-binding transcriptional regulator YafY
MLLNQQSVTAKALSEQFKVSVRTIYRDIDKMSQAGIPVYTERGKGGGISLLPDFVLNKVLLDSEERKWVLQALQTTSALNLDKSTDDALAKLSALFGEANVPWLDIDFSTWYGSNEADFEHLKTAILDKKVVTFDYYNSRGEQRSRQVEPIQLVFKSMNWYLKAYCLSKNDYRMFKLRRITRLLVTAQNFVQRVQVPEEKNLPQVKHEEMIHLEMLVASEVGYRIYDDFPIGTIQKYSEKDWLIVGDFPKTDWLYSYILSLGKAAKILSPPTLKQDMINLIKQMEENYHE